MPPVAVALLNWNGWELTIACIESLLASDYANISLFLCDNASSDGSVQRIAAWAEARRISTQIVDHNSQQREGPGTTRNAGLVIIRSPVNVGFAGGTNLAIRAALADGKAYEYMWVLNTDTTVDPEALKIAVRAMESHREAASAQSLLVWARDRNLLDSAGMKLLRRGGAVDMLRQQPRERVRGLANGRAVVPIFGSCAAAALYRVSILRELGDFDEMFMSGYEDVDIACRHQAHKRGAVLVPGSVVYHLGGPSRDMKKKGWMWWLGHRNKLWVIARWYPRALAVPILVFGILRALVAAARIPQVSFMDWWRMVSRISSEFVKGAAGATRQTVLRMGSSGVIEH